MQKTHVFLSILLSCFAITNAHAMLHVVAAENVYGEIAKEIGGANIDVQSILSNPNQDPHLFSATPQVAKTLADADIIVANGAGYDPWLFKLLSADTQAHFALINVADLVNVKLGQNPHLWYQPTFMASFAVKFTQVLQKKDAVHADFYQLNLQKFLGDNQSLQQQIAADRQKWQGKAVIATEPVMGYLANDLGLVMRGEGFQLSIMNNTEPSPADRAQFEEDIKQHHVNLLIYNQQVSDPVTQQMRLLAQQNHIPVLGVNELLPLGSTYHQWLTHILQQMQNIL